MGRTERGLAAAPRRLPRAHPARDRRDAPEDSLRAGRRHSPACGTRRARVARAFALACLVGGTGNALGQPAAADGASWFPYATRRQWPLPGEVVDWAVPAEATRAPAILVAEGEVFAFESGAGSVTWRRVHALDGEGRALVAAPDGWFAATAHPHVLHHLPTDPARRPVRVALPFEPVRLAVATDERERDPCLGVLGRRGELAIARFHAGAFALERTSALATPHAHDLVGWWSASDRPVFVIADGAARALVRCEAADDGVQRWPLDHLPRTLRGLAEPGAFLVCSGTPVGGDRVVLVRWNAGAPRADAILDSAGPVTIDAVLRDVDGDGVDDLSQLNLGHNQLEIRRGLRSAGFADPTTHHAGQLPERLALRDLDGDGAPDWWILAPSVRTLSVLANRRGAPATPPRVATAHTPLAFAHGEPPSAHTVLWDEGAGELVAFADENVQRHASPAGPLAECARFPGPAVRLFARAVRDGAWVHVALDGEARVVHRTAGGAGPFAGPLASGGAVWFAARGEATLQRVSWGEDPVAIDWPFPIAALVRAPRPDAVHAIGTQGELGTWANGAIAVQPGRLAMPPDGPALALREDPFELAFARGARLHHVRVTATGRCETLRAVELASPPTALVATSPGHLAAACPEAHVVELVDLATGRRTTLGAGLHPRDLLVRSTGDPGGPALLVLCTFSGEVLALRPMDPP